jgi:hypothetical protein
MMNGISKTDIERTLADLEAIFTSFSLILIERGYDYIAENPLEAEKVKCLPEIMDLLEKVEPQPIPMKPEQFESRHMKKLWDSDGGRLRELEEGLKIQISETRNHQPQRSHFKVSPKLQRRDSEFHIQRVKRGNYSLEQPLSSNSSSLTKLYERANENRADDRLKRILAEAIAIRVVEKLKLPRSTI